MDRSRLLQLVYNFLREEKFDLAATALAEDAPTINENDDAIGAFHLQRILSEYDELTAPRNKNKVILPDELKTKGDGVFVNTAVSELENIHTANILSVQFRNDTLYLSSVDRTIRAIHLRELPVDCKCDESKALLMHNSPVLCTHIHPTDSDLLLSGDMAGRVLLSRLSTGDVIQEVKQHSKYVVRTRWSACGSYFAVASYDKTAELYHRETPDAPFESKQSYNNTGAVETVAFTSAAVPEDEAELIIASRGDYELRLINLKTLAERRINLNALGDDFVSFTVLEVSCSPSGKFLLVSTDKSRLILFDRVSGQLLRNFYGATNDSYSQPRHCWHPSSKYIYSSSENHDIVVWDVASEVVVARLTGHKDCVRDMLYSPDYECLITTGFDRKVILWRHVDLSEE